MRLPRPLLSSLLSPLLSPLLASLRASSLSPFVPAFVGLAAALLVLVLPPARAEQRSYQITPEEMTRQAVRKFPIRRCALGLACVTLSEPQIALPPNDDRIHLTTRVKPELGGQTLDSGEVELAGKPRYDAARGAFFLDGARVVESRFPGLGQQQARTMSDLASSLLGESLRKEPIDVLDDNDSQQALARLVLREVQVRDGKLHLLVGDQDP